MTATLKDPAGSGGDDRPARSPSQQIDHRIAELADWRGEVLALVRGIVLQAEPEAIEEWKWRGVPVWSRNGMICTGETYKSAVKLTFPKGASLEDPAGLFNSGLEGKTRRAIDITEGEEVNVAALSALIKAASALNTKLVAERAVKKKPAPRTKRKSS